MSGRQLLAPWCRGVLCLVLLLGLLLQPSSAAELQKEQLRVGYMERVFLGVNPRDAEVAFKSFARTIGKLRGYDVDVSVRAFPSVSVLRKLPREERPDLMIYDNLGFVEAEDLDWVEPIAIAADQAGNASDRLLLLARDVTDGMPVSMLQGKHLNLLVTGNAPHGEHWLSQWLKEQGMASPGVFFARLERFADPMSAVLPVFFGKADAVLVDSGSFALMVELNPQVGRLHLLASSEPLANSVICLESSGALDRQFRAALLDAVMSLHKETAGQQILALFKRTRLASYSSGDMDSVRALYRKISAQSGGHPISREKG